MTPASLQPASPRRRRSRRRGGFTLLEVLVSTVVTTMILTAVGSTILLASRALPAPNHPLEARLLASAVLDELATELETALFVAERSATAITFIVPDRNGDGRSETLRYSWSGTLGDPLKRDYNSAGEVAIVTDVREFKLTYTYKQTDEPYPVPGGGGNYTATRYQVATVRAALLSGYEATARLETLIHALNLPDCVTAAWDANFASNPTRIDLMATGTWNFRRRDGASFNTASLTNGAWRCDATLDTRPLCNFDTLTTVEVRFRNITTGGNGAVFWINADWSGGLHAPIYAYLRRLSDATQTLYIYKKTSSSTAVLLTSVPSLGGGFVKLRLLIDPARDTVNIRVNDMQKGTYSYGQYAPASSDRFVTLTTSGSQSEFDALSVRVWSPAP